MATGSHDQLGVDVSRNNKAITIYDPKRRKMEGEGDHTASDVLMECDDQIISKKVQ